MKDSDAMNRLEEIFKSPMLQINLLAAVTGACAALMTWVFISMSQGIQSIFYGDSFIENSLKGTEREWLIIFIPALGGLIAGLIIDYWSKEAKGAGVPIVMEAVAVKEADSPIKRNKQALLKGTNFASLRRLASLFKNSSYRPSTR